MRGELESIYASESGTRKPSSGDKELGLNGADGSRIIRWKLARHDSDVNRQK